MTTPRIAPPPPQGHHALRALEVREQRRHRVSSFSLSVVGGIADGEIEWYDPLPPELVGRLIPVEEYFRVLACSSDLTVNKQSNHHQ